MLLTAAHRECPACLCKRVVSIGHCAAAYNVARMLAAVAMAHDMQQ